MQKAQLRKLRSLPATPAIVSKAKIMVERSQTYWDGVKKTWKERKYSVLSRAQQLGGFIKIAIFLPKDLENNIRTPKYEVFLNVKGEEYITRELDENGKEVRWLTAMVWNLPGIPYHVAEYITQDAIYTLNSQLIINNEPPISHGKASCEYKLYKGLKRVSQWQQQIKDKATKEKEKRETAPWDADMQLIPETPRSFSEWMRRHACKDAYMFYDYRKGGAKTGYCSICKYEVPIKDPRHNENSVCPKCGAKGLFKASGKCATLSTDAYFGQMVQKIKDGIVIRQFWQRQKFRDNYRNPQIVTFEFVRIIIPDKGPSRVYAWENYKNKCERWVKSSSKEYYGTYYWDRRMPLYKRNFKAVENSKIFARSTVKLWPELPCSLTAFLQFEKGNPAIEMLAKIGMFRLAKGLINAKYDKDLLNQSATEIAKILKIDNARLKRLKNMDADVKHLKWMQFEKLANTIWPDEMINTLAENGIAPSDFYFLDTPVNFVKAYNYIMRQQNLIPKISLWQILTTWRDYICMAEQLKMNTSLDQIVRPKDLKAAHDECVLLRESNDIDKEAAELRKKWKKAEKHLKQIQKFAYKKGEYEIVVPNSLNDIVREGRILKHCVHTCDYYFSRIQTDESYLFFLRKSKYPEMPWYTLEVEPSGNIRQKRTTGDNQNKDFEEAIGFLKDWQKFFRKKLTEKEKKLGEKADMLRKQNYAELRKNQNKIWHGKLAGQLLADVLEADFMEAAGI